MVNYGEMIQITQAKRWLACFQSTELASSLSENCHWNIDESIQGEMIPAMELTVVLTMIMYIRAMHVYVRNESLVAGDA